MLILTHSQEFFPVGFKNKQGVKFDVFLDEELNGATFSSLHLTVQKLWVPVLFGYEFNLTTFEWPF